MIEERGRGSEMKYGERGGGREREWRGKEGELIGGREGRVREGKRGVEGEMI